MVWSGYAIALFIVYVVQAAVVSLLGLEHVDLFLVLAITYGLMAPTYDARLAAWLAGLVQDLGTADPLGIHAFILGMTGLFVTHLREIGNADVWWMRLLIVFLAAWPAYLLYILYLHFWVGHGDQTLLAMAGSAAWTAGIASVLVLGLTSLPALSARRRWRRQHMSRG